MTQSASPATKRRWALPGRPQIILALFSVVFALAVVELMLRYLAPVADPFERFKTEDRAGDYVPSSHEPDYRLEITPEAGLPGITGRSIFTTNNLGFQGNPLVRPKPSDEYRIFLVGGSTMEAMVRGEADPLSQLVQRQLEGWPGGRRIPSVYNTAKSGDKSYDHVAMIVHRLVHLEPDMLVVMAGVNDLRAAMLGADYLQLASSRAVKYSLPMLLKFAATEFHIPRLLHAAARQQFEISERERLEQITLITDYRRKASLRSGHAVSERPPRTDVKPYEANLRTIQGVAREHAVAIVWATHPSTWNSSLDPRAAEWHWMTYLEGENYREDLLDRALDEYNDATRRVAGDHATPLVDLAREMPKSLEYFYDDVHFNTRGVARTGELMAEAIRETIGSMKEGRVHVNGRPLSDSRALPDRARTSSPGGR